MKAYLKNVIRTIFSNKRRYAVSLLILVLGVAVFTGLRSTAPSLRYSADAYFDDCNIYDFKLISAGGFSETDIKHYKTAADASAAEGAYSADLYVQAAGGKNLARIHSFNENSTVNKFILKSGKLPQNDSECLIEREFFEVNKIKLGDKVTLPTSEVLKETKFTICGVVDFPVYLSVFLGASSVGESLSTYMFVPQNCFRLSDAGIYTECFLTASKKAGMSRFSDEYKTVSDAGLAALEEAAPAGTYIFGITDNAGFYSFSQDCERIDAIGKSFPVIFFLVAVLVSFTCMVRIVQSDRAAIGTLVSLGYGAASIFNKYIIYALCVALPGLVLGIAAGFWFFPLIIYNFGYSILYTLPAMLTPLQIDISLYAALIAVLSMVVPAVLVCLKEVRDIPADLMRPKSPPPGKQILLEKIPFVWNKLKFSQKVTARNIFRKKLRNGITVLGILGCTAVALSGFGLSDAVKTIIPAQFDKISIYDMEISLENGTSSSDSASLTGKLDAYGISYCGFYKSSAELYKEGMRAESFVMLVPEEGGALSDFIKFFDAATGKPFEFNSSGVVITQKLAETFGYKTGDTALIRDADGADHRFYVAGITRNYINYFIYIPPSLYAEEFGCDAGINTFLANSSNAAVEPGNEQLTEQLLDFDFVRGLTLVSALREHYTDVINSINFIVLVLIVSGAVLAFVVLFSLTGINIDERQRELATLKVLGFYDSEAANYIFKENLILTLLGIALGLVAGIFLTRFIVSTAEVNLIMFGRSINALSFVISSALTLGFMLAVNLIMNRSIRKIDMIESLKSVE